MRCTLLISAIVAMISPAFGASEFDTRFHVTPPTLLADQLVNCVTNNDRYSVGYGQTCCLRLPQHITECHGGNIRPTPPPSCTGPGCATR
jgi:hypothetical protein